MSFSHENQAKGKSEAGSTNNSSANPPVYQPQPHQLMRNDYGRPSNTNEYHGPQRLVNHHSHSQGEEVPSYQRKLSFGGHSKTSNFNPYFRPEEPRYTSHGRQQVIERRTEAQPNEDTRNSNDNITYSFPSRDGPSPGRNYSYGIASEEMHPQQRHAPETSKPSSQNHPFRSPIPPPSNSQRNKRRASNIDPSTPDGPRLISNQSSDDSINALLPNNKRARVGSLFPSESASFFKSFNLSPMNSRTFSREETIDIPRFSSTRGSAEGNRIFHSWSSGNSRSENHSPSDVRNCYDDWHSASIGVRRNSSISNLVSRPPENKGPDHSNDVVPGKYDNRGPIGSNAPLPQPPVWQNSREPQQHMQSSSAFDIQKLDRGLLSNSRQLQPLHPEDRYNERSLLQGYNQGMDMGRPYWNSQGHGPPIPQLYTSQRRDDMEDRPNNPMIRGHHIHSTSTRVSAPTPPVTNGVGRYSYDYHHGMYEPHPTSARSSHRSHFDNNWAHPNARPRHFESQFTPEVSIKETNTAPINGSLNHLKNVTIESGENGTTGMRTSDGLLLLSLPEDRISLSETLCIVRENVEVFVATETDVKAPAPGRKRPVVEGQVGLRCIHCRAAIHQSEKVKRAVCFPSSIKRIYRTVIDMKLDHFKACRFVPVQLKVKLEELRASNARSTGTTMQYFVSAAKRMGMVDGGHGIRFQKPTISRGISQRHSFIDKPQILPKRPLNTESIIRRPSIKTGEQQQGVQPGVSFSLSLDLSISGGSDSDPSKAKASDETQITKAKKGDDEYYSGKVVLALPDDKSALSPLRCFLRENVCAFSATTEDIAVRTPTTFSVVLGQVGIGCIHCLSLPARERSNRAVCFPFSIARIYQSVADIQRFHLGECKMVPDSVRAKFLELQSASSKGSKGLATRQYWQSSAKKLGLADSDCGIRFARDPSIPLEKAKSLDILAQVASDVTTAAKPLVLAEDKPLIAEFLYVVMKQLQPCRFTEADRNKRRLKDVGCIGVECKHCAGQVDGRKYFWSSVNAVESNFVSVHTHMMECKQVPQEMKDKLAHLKTLRKEQTTKLKSGSQKAFFNRVWKRLHAGGNNIPSGGSPSNQKRNNVKAQPSPPKTNTGKLPKAQEEATIVGPPVTIDLCQPVHSTPSPPISDFNPSGAAGSPSSVSSQGSFSVGPIKTEEDDIIHQSKTKGKTSFSQLPQSPPAFPSFQITPKTDVSYAKEKLMPESLNSSFPTSPTLSPLNSPQITTVNNIASMDDQDEEKEEIRQHIEKI